MYNSFCCHKILQMCKFFGHSELFFRGTIIHFRRSVVTVLDKKIINKTKTNFFQVLLVLFPHQANKKKNTN